MRPRTRRRAAFAVPFLVAGLLIWAPPVAAISGPHPVVVVLCNFSNQTVQPNPPSYYEHMFSDAGAGELGALDYWNDVSYGKFSVSGTVVKGWYTLGITRDTWVGYDAPTKWSSCAAAAAGDVNYNNFSGAIAVFPEATTTTVGAMDALTTSMTVASTTVGDAANFPTPPFLLGLDVAPGSVTGETVNVTAISGTTFTIQRAQGGTTAKPHASGAYLLVPGDLKGFAQSPVFLAGNTYTLGGVLAAHDVPLSVFTHEMGHGFDFNHSRQLGNPVTDYFDCFDIMSSLSCTWGFTGAGTPFGGNFFGGFSKGPGLNAIQLDLQGWIPGGRETSFSNNACTQSTYAMAALNHPEASGYQELRIPASVTFTAVEGQVTSDYYTVELRSKTGWDRGIPEDAFLMHLEAANRSYWVNAAAGGTGQMIAGTEYVDTSSKAYVAVNSIDPSSFTGVITLGACKINATLTYSGDTSAARGDLVTLAGDLVVQGTTTPVPGASVDFTLGSQGCTGTTDAVGHASCTLTLNQNAPGPGTVSGSFAGDAAYNPASDSAAFTIFYRLTGLSPVHAWIGLKNSDDQGTQFDLKAELIKNGSTVLASGLARCLTGVTRNPTFAKDAKVSWDTFSPVILNSGDVLSLRLSTRIGTKLDETKCAGPGGSHSSAIGLRTYYDGATRQSHFDTTISTQNADQFLHSNGTVCTTLQSAGVTPRTIDTVAPTALNAKCTDSPVVKFTGGNPYKDIATWTMAALP